jgi:uncharacterized coiled-coil protein SlyX
MEKTMGLSPSIRPALRAGPGFMSNTGMKHPNDPQDTTGGSATDQRLTELEIKASFAEDLLDQLDKVIVRQQQQIDALLREVAELKASAGARRRHHHRAQPARRTAAALLGFKAAVLDPQNLYPQMTQHGLPRPTRGSCRQSRQRARSAASKSSKQPRIDADAARAAVPAAVHLEGRAVGIGGYTAFGAEMVLHQLGLPAVDGVGGRGCEVTWNCSGV